MQSLVQPHRERKVNQKNCGKNIRYRVKPLQEMGPLTNPGKMCLSKIWKLQVHLQKRQEQTRFDLKEKITTNHWQTEEIKANQQSGWKCNEVGHRLPGTTT